MSWIIPYVVISAFLSISDGEHASLAPVVPNRLAEADSLYSLIQLPENVKPVFEMFQMGLQDFQSLKGNNLLSEKDILTLIDFSKPSSEKRMWIIDVKSGRVLYHILVAHGKNSGELYATRFSNVAESHQSSLGAFVTGQVYNGKNGLSLKLHGMQDGLNSRAEERAIVIHGASYVSDDFVSQVGRLGRSHGCPAIPMDVHKEVIKLLADGTFLFIYFPGMSGADALPKSQYYTRK